MIIHSVNFDVYVSVILDYIGKVKHVISVIFRLFRILWNLVLEKKKTWSDLDGFFNVTLKSFAYDSLKINDMHTKLTTYSKLIWFLLHYCWLHYKKKRNYVMAISCRCTEQDSYLLSPPNPRSVNFLMFVMLYLWPRVV